ncbi:TIGR03619 family F420-dependent LLM class oxidoreductase [Gordonia humi]|uniref:Putative F420-dependent oxidoreductase n=1 Tax=Gordonia humi TaxID=686429 RepID=A0A840EUE0_9ACTN|nr:TIGR03619 family F420-dependent LLM class oxidoreductase [Gordonia humi]MBB4135191.1 putative F420-dependent oxidoreductase [Gordonia humi]
MKFNLMFPMRAVKHYAEWIEEGSLGEVARRAEEAGFEGFSMSEHPYPDREWLADGGHHAFDPFVSLAIAAEATERIRLITYLMVVGYRNPYLGGKAVASLDTLSNGRLTVGVGAGYLKSEFDALGADFANRGRKLDEGIAAMRAMWRGEEHDGPEFGRSGHASLPLPTTPGGPPIWVGGNSKAARRRAVEIGDGWMPIAQSAEMAAITRTPALDGIDPLAAQIADLNTRRADRGAPPCDVVFAPFEARILRRDGIEAFVEALAPAIGEYEAAGVTWLTIEPTSRSLSRFREDLSVLRDGLVRR